VDRWRIYDRDARDELENLLRGLRESWWGEGGWRGKGRRRGTSECL